MTDLFDNRRFRIAIVILLIVIAFINNGLMSYWDQDEAAYAAFAYRMIEKGNYLIPDFFWSDMHRKPPLHFWSIVLSYKIFGVNEFAVRFPSALSVALLYLVVLAFVRRVFPDGRTAIYSVIVLATSLFVPVLAKVSVTDGGLLLYSTLCAVALYYVLEHRSFPWVLIFWGAFALALLTKGPPILLFTGIFGLLLLIFHSARKNLLLLHPWFFLPLAAAPLIYWGYLCNQQDGGAFTRWLIDWYVLKRIGGSVFGQTGPPGTHIAIIFVVFLPYLVFFPAAVKQAFLGLKQSNTDRFLGAWFIAGWLLFEFLPSKLPAYVVVAHVPLAILVGRNMATADMSSRPKALSVTQFIFTSLLYLGICTAPFIFRFTPALQYTLIASGAILLLLNVYTFFRAGATRFIPALLGLNIVFQLLLWGVIVPPAVYLKNTQKDIAAFVSANATQGSRVVIGNFEGFPPSLPFYLYLNFRDLYFENNKDNVGWQNVILTDSAAFVLNKEQRDHLLGEDSTRQFTEFTSILTDRNEKASYYIMIKK